MIDTFQNIKIHNVHYNVNELMVLCKEKIINSQVQNWEKEFIYSFRIGILHQILLLFLHLVSTG